MTLKKNIISHNFGRRVADYEKNSRLQRRVGHELIARSKNLQGLVLDVGAGTGFIRINTGLDLVEIDISPAVCRTNGGSVICADAEKLPFADASFDGVISSLTFQWCDDAAAAAEAFRVLKKNGRASVATFGSASVHELRAAGGNVIEFGSAMRYFAAFKKAGFEKLNIDSQKIIYLYDDIYELMGSIKNIGASYPFGKGLKTKRHFSQLENLYRAQSTEEGKLKLTWEVLYITGVKK
jgi:malonyl-CoA O-methyltransferase